VDFPDKELHKVREEIKLYKSETLAKLWPFGFSTIGEVTFQSCAYVARYVTKKITGEKAKDHYMRWDPSTGEGTPIEPEYATMSRGNNYPVDDPRHTRGIGYDWFQKYKSDVYPHDYVVLHKHKIRPPRYYDKLLPEHELEELKKKRQEELPEVIDEYNENMDRLWVEEAVKENRLNMLIREL
jgi:hypothetical protein